jgi:hypothetical protein
MRVDSERIKNSFKFCIIAEQGYIMGDCEENFIIEVDVRVAI